MEVAPAPGPTAGAPPPPAGRPVAVPPGVPELRDAALSRDLPKKLADWTVCTIRFPKDSGVSIETEGLRLAELVGHVEEVGRGLGVSLHAPPELPPSWAEAEHGPLPGSVLLAEDEPRLAVSAIKSRRRVVYPLEGVLFVGVGFLFAAIIAFNWPPLFLIGPLLVGGFGAGALLARASARLFESRVTRIQLWPIAMGGPIEGTTRCRVVIESGQLMSVNHQTRSDPHRSVHSVLPDGEAVARTQGLVAALRRQLPLAPPPPPPAVRRVEIRSKAGAGSRSSPPGPKKPRARRRTAPKLDAAPNSGGAAPPGPFLSAPAGEPSSDPAGSPIGSG